MTALATLTKPDGTTAELRPDYSWASGDAQWAELLNVGFDPTLDYDAQPAGLPAYAATVERAAAKYGAEASYPWSDSPKQAGTVY